jgi:Ni2+-binding GTPase involved in maturation of urease and hydrogenase
MDIDLSHNIECFYSPLPNGKNTVYEYTNRIETGQIRKVDNLARLCALTAKDKAIKHSYCENLVHGRWVKIFFDYDFALPVGTQVTPDVISRHTEICERALTTFFRFFDPTFEVDKHVVVAQRHGIKVKDDKEIPHVSFHWIVVNGVRTKLEYMVQIMRDFHCLNSVFDTSVYSDGRKFAMLWGYKSDLDLRRKVPLRGTQEDFVIQYVPEHYNRVLKYVSQSSIEETDNHGRKRIRNYDGLADIKPFPVPETMDYDFDKNDVTELMKRLPNNTNFDDFDKWISVAYALKECGMFKQTPLSDDQLCELFHRFSAAHPRYRRDAVDRVFQGASKSNSGFSGLGIRLLQMYLERIYPGFWKTYHSVSLFAKDLHEINSAANKVRFDEVYDAPYMKPYPIEEHSIVCVKGATGLGKTVQLLETLKRIPDEYKVCVLSYSVTLCRKYHAMFESLGFKLYSDLTGPIMDDRVIVCLDSLERLQYNTCFDHLVIDEALSVCEHFDSDKMKNPSFVSHVLTKMMHNSSQILMMDANIDSLMVFDLVQMLERKLRVQSYWIHNTHIRKTNRKVQFMTGKYDTDGYIAYVLGCIKKNKRVVCPLSSKDTGEKLYTAVVSAFPELVVKKYDSESKRSDLYNDSLNTNAWKNVDVLIYTPTISAGVSFELDRFDMLIAFFHSSMFHAPVNTCFQQLFRVRQLNTGKMILFTDVHGFDKLVVDAEHIDDFLQYSCKKVTTLYQNTGAFVHTNDMGEYGFRTDQLSFPIVKNIVLAKNRSLTFFKKILTRAFEAYRIPVKDVDFQQKSKKKFLNPYNDEDSWKYFVETFDDTKKRTSLVLSPEALHDVEQTLRKGKQELDKKTLVMRNITMNLNNWKTNIHQITQDFFTEFILTTDNKTQRDAYGEYIQACRYKRLEDPVQIDVYMLHGLLAQGHPEHDRNFAVLHNMKKTGMQQMIATKKMLASVFEMTDLAKLKDRSVVYKNTYWKPRLVEYLKTLSKEEFEHTLGIFGLFDDRSFGKCDDGEHKNKRAPVSFKDVENYNNKGSNKSKTVVRTMVEKTFGMTMESANKMGDRFYFVDDKWSAIIEENMTFLSRQPTATLDLPEPTPVDKTHEDAERIAENERLNTVWTQMEAARQEAQNNPYIIPDHTERVHVDPPRSRSVTTQKPKSEIHMPVGDGKDYYKCSACDRFANQETICMYRGHCSLSCAGKKRPLLTRRTF